jgi:hypothetical protein
MLIAVALEVCCNALGASREHFLMLLSIVWIKKLLEDYLHLMGYEDRAHCSFYMKKETEPVSETSFILLIHPLDITQQKYFVMSLILSAA